MDMLSIVGIAFGLSLDAFTVSLTNSTVIRELNLRHGLRMSVFFGFFQMIMPIIGWAAGISFNQYIQGFDHWIAFGLLSFVGGRMIISGLPFISKEQKNDCTDKDRKDCRSLPTLLVLSIATSIDAMAVGLSFAIIKVKILLPALVIGIITFIISLTGYFLGKKIGNSINIKLDLAGGIILIGIGLKILAEHLL